MSYKTKITDRVAYIRPIWARERYQTLFNCRVWSPYIWISDEEHPQHEYMPSELQVCKSLTADTIERMMMPS